MEKHSNHTSAVRNRKEHKAMDYDASPTISTEFLGPEEECSTSVRGVPELNDNGECSTTGQESIASLDSPTDVGCSRLLGDIQAGLQADLSAAKVLYL